MPKKFFIFGLLSLIGAIVGVETRVETSPGANAASCPKMQIIFARGSGAEKDKNKDFLDFKDKIEEKIGGWGISHEYIDLDYEARGVGIDNIGTLIGAFFGAGDAYDFGASVDDGVKKLTSEVKKCPATKYVLGGYSQGAMVVSKAIRSIDANRIIYVATFGDPKLYLPEGKSVGSLEVLKPLNGAGKNLLHTGTIPAACKNENLSEYRMYVPDCYAYEGMLGSYKPYQPTGYSGKLGTWCNKHDIFCSSYLSVSSHTSYVSDGLYEDASRVIVGKIADSFKIISNYSSPHDTAILIDSTGSMADLIDKYRTEALNLASKTFEKGGRVALYDYGDFADVPEPHERCSFDTCTLEKIKAELSNIETTGGGDDDESLLSASLKVMKKLEWRYGATKSVVALTDAGYHDPDLDGTTFDEIVALSKSIDPVNFYIITLGGTMWRYNDLATSTGGMVVSSSSDLALLIDAIIARFDSLPRVEETSEFDSSVPMLEIESVERSGSSVTVRFISSGTKVLVALNDALLGATEDSSVTINGLDSTVSNTLRLIPINENRRGESVEIKLNNYSDLGRGNLAIPKAPNAGKR